MKSRTPTTATVEKRNRALNVARACLSASKSNDPSETTYRAIMILQRLVAPRTIENPVTPGPTRAKRLELLNLLNGLFDVIEWDLTGRRWAGEERRWTGEERRAGKESKK